MGALAYQDERSGGAVRLAPVTGADEAAVGRGDAASAYALLRRLARGADGAPLPVERMSVSDADRLLAAIYRDLYDDRAECRLACGACGEAYQFTLSLSELIAAQDADRPAPPDEDGAWVLPDGRRVRAPTLADLAESQDPRTLIARLVVAGEPGGKERELQAFLDRAAPLLSLDLDTDCPHCGSKEIVRFDLAHYLAARLAGERAFLIRETHLIAGRYGWSLGEIYALGRHDRRAYAGLIEAERATGQRHVRRLA